MGESPNEPRYLGPRPVGLPSRSLLVAAVFPEDLQPLPFRRACLLKPPLLLLLLLLRAVLCWGVQCGVCWGVCPLVTVRGPSPFPGSSPLTGLGMHPSDSVRMCPPAGSLIGRLLPAGPTLLDPDAEGQRMDWQTCDGRTSMGESPNESYRRGRRPDPCQPCRSVLRLLTLVFLVLWEHLCVLQCAFLVVLAVLPLLLLAARAAAAAPRRPMKWTRRTARSCAGLRALLMLLTLLMLLLQCCCCR